MNRVGKDSAEVVKFRTLFERLKEWCDDAYDELGDLARTDSSVEDLCTQLYFAARVLKMNERRRRVLFAKPVDPAFITAWRDYEERYEAIVSDIWATDLLRLLGLPEADSEKSSS